ncbi:unnamed protein product [Caenorhabditis angaria]|uniref:Uncharacterized protein n=1 Tax=Caenorhabditis angaria TaxID=860376 RepID=A0A9P1J4H1_9PELO|nr:unnamed protein product [Caenorhabditis angaria]
MIFRQAASLHSNLSRLYEMIIANAERDANNRDNLNDIMRHIRRTHRSIQDNWRYFMDVDVFFININF